MSFLDKISFGFRSKLPVILQTEAAECGLACLSMVASFHGYAADLSELRGRFPVSLKGGTLAQLMRVAGRLHMGTRPLQLEVEELDQLALPCILH